MEYYRRQLSQMWCAQSIRHDIECQIQTEWALENCLEVILRDFGSGSKMATELGDVYTTYR